jgi:dihydroneopterin triphosphate diphosphatase
LNYKTPISALVLIHTSDLQVLSIEGDETPKQAAIREVIEETGLDATKFDLQDWQASNVYEIYPHWRHRYAPGVVENTEHLFGLELPSKLAIKLAPDEHVRYQWVDWREAANLVFSWTNVDALKRLGEKHGMAL